MNVPPADPSQQHDTLLPFGNGEIASVALSLYSAPKGQNRPVDAYVVTECEGNFTGSARRAAETVYSLAQKCLPRIEPMVVGFDIQGISPGTSPVTGESGGLVFAIALAGKLFQNNPGPIAATGVIINSGGDGPIGRVDKIASKLTSASNTLPKKGCILYPAENSEDIPESVFTLAKQRQISLHPVSSIAQAISILFDPPVSDHSKKQPLIKSRRQTTVVVTTFLILLILLTAVMVVFFRTEIKSPETSSPSITDQNTDHLPGEPPAKTLKTDPSKHFDTGFD